jgi:hypothetical protein
MRRAGWLAMLRYGIPLVLFGVVVFSRVLASNRRIYELKERIDELKESIDSVRHDVRYTMSEHKHIYLGLNERIGSLEAVVNES